MIYVIHCVIVALLRYTDLTWRRSKSAQDLLLKRFFEHPSQNMKQIGETFEKYRNIRIVGADAFSSEGFTQIPNAILRSKEIAGMEKCTYALLLSYAWHNDYCFPGQDRLAKDLGCSRASANSYIKNLRQKGFINVKRQGLNKPNIYELNLKAKVLKTRKNTGL